MIEHEKLFKAMIWKGSQEPGMRVEVKAKNISEAKSKLEEMYGKGTIFDLHNEEDANRKR